MNWDYLIGSHLGATIGAFACSSFLSVETIMPIFGTMLAINCVISNSMDDDANCTTDEMEAKG